MPRRIYISFADEDRAFRDGLVKHLAVPRRSGAIEVRDATDVGFVGDARSARLALLDAAEVIVLLLSAGYFASEECSSHDLTRSLERSDRHGIQLIPVIVRDVNLEGTPFAERRVLPKNGKPMGSAQNHKGWAEIVTVLRSLTPPPGSRPPSAPAPPPSLPLGLSGAEVKAFRDALVSAFPTYPELDQLFCFGFERSLHTISPPAPIGEVTFALIRWAERHNLVENLLQAARIENPGNVALRLFAEEIEAVRAPRRSS